MKNKNNRQKQKKRRKEKRLVKTSKFVSHHVNKMGFVISIFLTQKV